MRAMNISVDDIAEHSFHTLIVGAGAAGMSCAKALYEQLAKKGVEKPETKIAVLSRGTALGTSRMSGSDKQTYYKLGTAIDSPDSPAEFAATLTAGGCCHGDLALAEGIGSLRAFYNLVEAGVPFPHDALGSYTGYKTDHDPRCRGTSAGPKTSKYMSECLQKIVRGYGIQIFDRQEVIDFIRADSSDRITGVLAIDRGQSDDDLIRWRLFRADSLVLAAGGPGNLYADSVYPRGQSGLHAAALRAGLTAENLTEFQFGIASTKFRWNTSGSYMQAIPHIFSTDQNGGDPREFLAEYFPTTASMASAIFLKGYQWPFDPDKVEGFGSSLVDIAVHLERVRNRRVYLDFIHNPIGADAGDDFELAIIDDEALDYLEAAGATQEVPIERLRSMNPQAIGIYLEHGIDISTEPLEVAVCAQHANGGFAVNAWWESNIERCFVIGEMAGTHGVKRPGGSALNAGQVGAHRAAELIANRYAEPLQQPDKDKEIAAIKSVAARIDSYFSDDGMHDPSDIVAAQQRRMTNAAAHIRDIDTARAALAVTLHTLEGMASERVGCKKFADILQLIEAENILLCGAAHLTALVETLAAGGGSRGSYLVRSADGKVLHEKIADTASGEIMRFKEECIELRDLILRIRLDERSPQMFTTNFIRPRIASIETKSFERMWDEYCRGEIYKK